MASHRTLVILLCTFREVYSKGKNFDEVRKATEGSHSGRPKEVPLGIGAKAGKVE